MEDDAKNRPLLQRVFESVGFLITIGLGLPIVFYFLWGILEIFSISAMPSYSF